MAISIGPKIGIDGEADYRKSLQNIIQETKTLDAQMKALKSSFDDSADSEEQSAKEHENLKKKQEALKRACEEMQKAVDHAKNEYGETSTEALKWEASLAKCETALNDVNKQLAEYEDSGESSKTAMEELTDNITAQEAELSALKEQYVNAALELGNDSDEAQALANEISNLSSELLENRSALDEAKASADSFDKTLEETGGDATETGGLFSSMGSTIEKAVTSSIIFQGIENIGQLALDAGAKALEMAGDWSEAAATVAQGTGKIGDDLTEMTNLAYEASAAVKDANQNAGTFASTVAELNTRFGMEGGEVQQYAEDIGKFAKITGQDATNAVDGLADLVKQWGAEAEDIPRIMDLLTVAGQSCDAGVGNLTSTLTDNAYQFGELGYSMEDALAYLISMEDAGIDADTAAQGLKNAIKNLHGEVDDVPGTFQEAIDMIADCDDKTAVLDETVGDTGKTISEIFGERAAQQIVQAMTTGTDSVDTFKEALDNSNGAMETTYENSITLDDQFSVMSENIKARVSETIGPAFTAFVGFMAEATGESATTAQNVNMNTASIAEGLAQAAADSEEPMINFKQMFEDAKTTASDMKDGISQKFGEMKESITEKAGDAKRSLKDKFDGMKEDADRIVSDIVSGFKNMKITFPKIPSMHITWGEEFKLGSKGLKITVPVPHIEFYAKAMDEIYALEGATMFGMMGGSALVGGETGREYILGDPALRKLISDTAKQTSSNAVGSITLNVYGSEGQDVNELAELVEQRLVNSIKRGI